MIKIPPVYLHDHTERRLLVVHCEGLVREREIVCIKPNIHVIRADNRLEGGRWKHATTLATVETRVTSLDDSLVAQYAFAAVEAACGGGRYIRIGRNAALAVKAEYEAAAGGTPQLLLMP